MVFFASRAVPLALQSLQILVVEALYLECLHQHVVPLGGCLVDRGEQRLVVQEDVPVLVHVVEGGVEMGQQRERSRGGREGLGTVRVTG